MATTNYNLPQWGNNDAYGKVKLVEDSAGNAVIVTLGVING
jgi:hypothetical protein|nr:MAG TPA: hypothetical protein [Caudoviricetes sp.]